MQRHGREQSKFRSLPISVKIQSAPEVPQLEGRSFPFHTRNLSLEGMEMTVDMAVPVGSLLELKIELGNPSCCYWHQGTVIWDVLRHAAGPRRKPVHAIGVRFNCKDNPQFSSWQAALMDLFARKRMQWLH